jgi:hypothetical protein
MLLAIIFENHAAGLTLYTKEVDADDDALYMRIKRNDIVTEVRVYPPGEYTFYFFNLKYY